MDGDRIVLGILAVVSLAGSVAGIWLALEVQREALLYFAIAVFVAPFWCSIALAAEALPWGHRRHLARGEQPVRLARKPWRQRASN